MTAPLRRVLLRRPAPRVDSWREYGWRAAPDPAGMAREHDQLCELLAGRGVDVLVGEPTDPGNPDAIYVYDPALVADDGALMLRPGKAGRRSEPDLLAADLSLAGIPVLARLEEPAIAEGGDTLWLDSATLLVGLGYRTNEAGVQALRDALPGVEVIAYDLAHHRGAGEVLHLMSFISPLADELAAVFLPLMPVRMAQLLQERGVRFVEVPADEFETMGPNVLALAPGVVVALEGNTVTRRRMEHAGVEVLTYRGDEISRKGDGGPTCLTRPLWRE